MQRTNRMKIVVADDELVIANTLAIILKEAGFNARAVYSGDAAVKTSLAFGPDMLICDVKMNGMSGIQAAIIVQTMLPSCKILLFSGEQATVDLLENTNFNGRRFEVVAKPIHPHDLLARLAARQFARPN
jgi:DNA-binding response OmpR family regulator